MDTSNNSSTSSAFIDLEFIGLERELIPNYELSDYLTSEDSETNVLGLILTASHYECVTMEDLENNLRGLFLCLEDNELGSKMCDKYFEPTKKNKDHIGLKYIYKKHIKLKK